MKNNKATIREKIMVRVYFRLSGQERLKDE